MNTTREGIIKVANSNFNPVIAYLNGRTLWGGTKWESPGYDYIDIDKKHHKLAFDFLDKPVKFTTKENRFGETIAELLLNKK